MQEQPADNEAWYMYAKGLSEGRKSWYARLADSYREGYQRSQAYFRSGADTGPSSEEPLRQSDAIAAVGLTVILWEALFFGCTSVIVWLCTASDAFAMGPPQARLVGAAAKATAFRSASRLPRLIVEAVTLPLVRAQVRARPVSERATFVKDRASQTVAIVVVVLLTLRAFNARLLRGTTAPAALELTQFAGRMLGPLPTYMSQFPLVRSLCHALHVAWAWVLDAGTRTVALDAAARRMWLLGPLYALAELEGVMTGPARFVSFAMVAFVNDVVKPILRTLGFNRSSRCRHWHEASRKRRPHQVSEMRMAEARVIETSAPVILHIAVRVRVGLQLSSSAVHGTHDMHVHMHMHIHAAHHCIMHAHPHPHAHAMCNGLTTAAWLITIPVRAGSCTRSVSVVRMCSYSVFDRTDRNSHV